jgi:hypothetical protein
VIRKIVCFLPNSIVKYVDVELRRAFGFYTLVFGITGLFLWGRVFLFISVLSVLALVPNYLSETPVKIEDKEDKDGRA